MVVAFLEDVIAILTDSKIVGFNVYEIQPKACGSLLAEDKSIYVVELPDSDRVHHQSTRSEVKVLRAAQR
jgi:hypothetical protein